MSKIVLFIYLCFRASKLRPSAVDFFLAISCCFFWFFALAKSRWFPPSLHTLILHYGRNENKKLNILYLRVILFFLLINYMENKHRCKNFKVNKSLWLRRPQPRKERKSFTEQLLGSKQFTDHRFRSSLSFRISRVSLGRNEW